MTALWRRRSSKIAARKGKADAAKAKLYGKIGKLIAQASAGACCGGEAEDRVDNERCQAPLCRRCSDAPLPANWSVPASFCPSPYPPDAQAVRAGGPDQVANARLREALAAAKAAQVPSDIVERNIKRASESKADYAGG